jgi:hypothetical protein
MRKQIDVEQMCIMTQQQQNNMYELTREMIQRAQQIDSMGFLETVFTNREQELAMHILLIYKDLVGKLKITTKLPKKT